MAFEAGRRRKSSAANGLRREGRLVAFGAARGRAGIRVSGRFQSTGGAGCLGVFDRSWGQLGEFSAKRQCANWSPRIPTSSVTALPATKCASCAFVTRRGVRRIPETPSRGRDTPEPSQFSRRSGQTGWDCPCPRRSSGTAPCRRSFPPRGRRRCTFPCCRRSSHRPCPYAPQRESARR